jgi:hypothetical protein
MAQESTSDTFANCVWVQVEGKDLGGLRRGVIILAGACISLASHRTIASASGMYKNQSTRKQAYHFQVAFSPHRVHTLGAHPLAHTKPSLAR